MKSKLKSLSVLALALAFGFALFGSFGVTVVRAQSPDAASEQFKFKLDPLVQENLKTTLVGNLSGQGVNYVLSRAIAILAGTIGSVSLLMVVLGGFQMLASAGDEHAYEQGKGRVKFALIGLAVALGAYLLVTAVQLLVSSVSEAVNL